MPNFKRALDEMEQYFSKDKTAKFDEVFFATLLKAMSNGDDLLVPAHEKFWKEAFFEYAENNGTDSDWEDTPDYWGKTGAKYHEALDKCNTCCMGGVTAFEPSNYVSNVAFYHSLIELDNYPYWSKDAIEKGYLLNLKRAFAHMAAGSAQYHAS